MNFRSNSPRSFGGKSFFEYKHDESNNLKNEIENQQKDYILSVNEDEYKNYLIEKYKLDLLVLNVNTEEFEEPRKVKLKRNDRGEEYEVNGYEFTVKYSYEGSPKLFQLSPSQKTLTGYEIKVEAERVSFVISIDKQDPELFQNTKQQAFKSAFANLENINKDAQNWNSEIIPLINKLFNDVKNRYINENSFFEAIKVKVDPNTKSVFTAPTIKRKNIPQPQALKKEFTSEPTMSLEMYLDTLKVLYDMGRSMERKPSTYKGKDEEDLRDYFITLLESRYDSTTITGETFNKGGKTDILLKYQDGTNLFVGECKWWKGESEFHSAINQLFDNYLTWRDSKTALVFFVKNKEISKVCDKIKEEAEKHPYYLSYEGSKGEGSFSYKFHLPSDKNKIIFLEILAFHFIETDKNK